MSVIDIDDEARADDNARLITVSEFRRLLGGISEMTEWRWRDKFDDYPRPVNIGRRRFYRHGDAIAFIDNRAAG